MSYKNFTAAATALALAAVPTIASAAPVAGQNPASALSLTSSSRVATATKGKSNLTRGATIGIVLALGVVAGGIIAVANDDDDDRPTSR